MSTAAKQSSATVWECSNEDYHADRSAVSNSSKEAFRKDRYAYYCQYVTGTLKPSEATEARLLGSHIHAALLEPDRYVNDYIVPPKFDRRTTVGKQGFAEFAREHAGKQFIDADLAATVSCVREAAMANKQIRALLEADGLREHTINWLCPDTWMPLKSRRDLVLPSLIADIKSCNELTEESFPKTIIKNGYGRQGAFYQQGELHFSGEKKPFVFIALCTKPPYGVGLFTLREDWIRLARIQNKTILRQMHQCQLNPDLYIPEYAKRVLAVDLPEWANYEVELDHA